MIRILDFWRRQKALKTRGPVAPLVPIVVKKNDSGPAALPLRARKADTDGRLRRRRQLVEDNRLL
jgi:hypothetical protein